jgi:hypothetical protein
MEVAEPFVERHFIAVEDLVDAQLMNDAGCRFNTFAGGL